MYGEDVTVLVVLTGTSPIETISKRRKQTFAYLAESARRLGLPLVVATPAGFEANTVHGWRYDGTRAASAHWRPLTRRLERYVVYDAMFISELAEQKVRYKKLMQRFRRQGVAYFNPTFPAKDVVCQILLSSPLHGHIPRTQFRADVAAVEGMLQHADAVWFKPVWGSGGRNMLYIRRLANNRYDVVGDRFYGKVINGHYNTRDLRRLLASGLKHRRYFVQQHVPLVQTKDGCKVDFRVTLYRNHTGDWQNCSVTARIGKIGSYITNFHGGARVQSLTEPTPDTEALLVELGMSRADLRQAVDLAMQAARLLSMTFPNMAIAGFDIGQTQNGLQYVYDCNSRPGRDILNRLETNRLMDGVTGFASYLLNDSVRNRSLAPIQGITYMGKEG